MPAFYECFIDGAARNNGKAHVRTEAACAVVIYKNKKEVAHFARALGDRSNNQAEYEALIQCLLMCVMAELPRPTIYSDSSVVVNQMNGRWKITSPDLLPCWLSAQELKKNYAFDLVQVPRSKVFLPDELCNKVLDDLDALKEKQAEDKERTYFRYGL